MGERRGEGGSMRICGGQGTKEKVSKGCLTGSIVMDGWSGLPFCVCRLAVTLAAAIYIPADIQTYIHTYRHYHQLEHSYKLQWHRLSPSHTDCSGYYYWHALADNELVAKGFGAQTTFKSNHWHNQPSGRVGGERERDIQNEPIWPELNIRIEMRTWWSN